MIDEHVKIKHSPDKNEDVRLVCIICKHEFIEADDYDGHVRMHGIKNNKESNDQIELNNVVLNLVHEHHIQEFEMIHSNDMTNDEGNEPIMCEKLATRSR